VQPEVGQDLRADAELAERAVGEAGRAGRIRTGRGLAGHGEQRDLGGGRLAGREIDDDAPLLGFDAPDRLAEVAAALARRRREDVADDRARVHAAEDGVRSRQRAERQRDELTLVAGRLVGRDRPAAARLVEHDGARLDAAHETLGLEPVLDQIRDGDDAEAVLLAEDLEVRHAGHRAVLFHDLADDAAGVQSGEPREIDRAFGLTGAHEHAAGARAERKDMAGRDELLGPAVGARRDADGVRAIGGADPGGDARARLDAHREGGAERRTGAPGRGHHRQIEPGDGVFGERQADEAAPMRGHEVDGLGRDELRRHREVALVLAILVVDEDDHLARADVGDGAVHAFEELRFDVERGGHVYSTGSRLAGGARSRRRRRFRRSAWFARSRGGARRTARGGRPRR